MDTPTSPTIKGFLLGELLGEGGYSRVWAARRTSDGRPLAIKVGADASPSMTERFRREATVLQRIRAPHVPTLHASGVLESGLPFLVMDRLSGRTLATLLEEQPELSLERALKLAGLILRALSAAHDLDIVHLDLKPENLFLTGAEGEPEGISLLDFGLTRAIGEAGTAAGTPHFMAPEQIRGDPGVDARADVYAFGVILFRMLTGTLPFVGGVSAVTRGHLALRPPRPGRRAPIPEDLEALVLACLSKDPRRRPRDAAEIQRALAGREPGATTPGSMGAQGGESAALETGRQPVVLLLADSRAPMPAVTAAITRNKGAVAGQRGGRYVAVFSGRDTDSPALAAHCAAAEIAAGPGGRAALHLSSLAVRARGRGLASEADVLRPERWAPAEPWSGVVVSPEVAALLCDVDEPSLTLRDPPSDSAPELVERQGDLVGRDAALEALAQSAAAALAESRPGLVTVLGEVGAGKTRMALEATVIARRVAPDTEIVLLLPEPASRAPQGVAQLLGAALDAPEAGAPDALHDQAMVETISEGLRRRAARAPLTVVVDDAHWADAGILEALEAATLDGEGIALWVVVAAPPRFEQLHPGWGTRTQRFTRVALDPLATADAMALAAELLQPVEYPPAPALRKLAEWAGGNPRCLAEVVGLLKRTGVVRRRAHSESWYLATAELDGLTASPARQWLAARHLEALPPDLASCARLCAVLGPSFTVAELEWILDAIEQEGGAAMPIDAGFGAEALVEHALLRRTADDTYAFITPVLRDAIVEMLDPAVRAAIHRRTLVYWQRRIAAEGSVPSHLERLAMHASAGGARAEAAQALVQLGDLACARHRHVEADQRYTAAFELDAGTRSAAALLQRARCRYRMHWPREAMDDLGAARAAAGSCADPALLVEILLEEATALDWAEDFEGSAQKLAEASALAARLDLSGFGARFLVAEGRTSLRRGRMEEAADLLSRAIRRGAAELDHDTHTVALLLLPVTLVFVGRLDEAGAIFDAALELTSAAEDWPHACQTRINRAVLWAARKDVPSALEDMSRAVRLAREIGNPFLERQATLNAAELLLWEGRRNEALVLARRARLLEQRFLERPVPEASVLLARLLVADGELREAARLVDEVGRTCRPEVFSPSARALYGTLQRVLFEMATPLDFQPAESWDAILAGARGAVLDLEMLEMLHWRARVATLGGRAAEARRTLDEAAPLIREYPLWRARFEELGRPGASVA